MTTTFCWLLQSCGLFSGLECTCCLCNLLSPPRALAICVQVQFCDTLSAWIRLVWKDLCKEERWQASSRASSLHLEAASKLRFFPTGPCHTMVGKSESGQSRYWARPCPADLISRLDLGTACYFWPAQVAFFRHALLSCLDLIGRLVSWVTSLCEAACFCCVREWREQGCSLTDSKQGVEGGHNACWGQWPKWQGAERWQCKQF